MKQNKTILFVCSGNVFRSFSAEYLLKKYLKEKKIFGWKISSAGITAIKQKIAPKTIECLKRFGVKRINHEQRKLNKKILKENKFVIAMGKNHVEFVKKNFDLDIPLFNEISINNNTPIPDIHEVVINYKNDKMAVEKHICKTITHIHKNIPKLFEKISKTN